MNFKALLSLPLLVGVVACTPYPKTPKFDVTTFRGVEYLVSCTYKEAYLEDKTFTQDTLEGFNQIYRQACG